MADSQLQLGQTDATREQAQRIILALIITLKTNNINISKIIISFTILQM